MKKRYIFLIMIILGVGVFRDSYTQTKGQKYINVGQELGNIREKYDEKFYYSLFSLDEIRPYLIVNIHKLSEIYENKWIPPGEILKVLSETEKDSVVGESAKVIQRDFKDDKERMLLRIKSWCLIDKQMDFLKEHYEFERKLIVRAMNNIFVTEKVLGETNSEGSIDMSKVTDLDADKAYYSGLNIISNLSFPHQLKYTAQLYHEISMIISE